MQVANMLWLQAIRWGQIARDNNTTVDELAVLNGIENVNLIRVGQVLRLPDGGNGISIGDVVRVREYAIHWATGERIASWVLEQEFEVVQVRNDGMEILLSGVMSWINISDIKSV